jgi:hypothetical protein
MNVRGTSSQPGSPTTVAPLKSTVHKRTSADAKGVQGSEFEPKVDDAKSIQVVRTADSADPAVSEDEKKFFQELFPTAAEEIRVYTPYQKNGKQQPSPLGSLFDVKG